MKLIFAKGDETHRIDTTMVSGIELVRRVGSTPSAAKTRLVGKRRVASDARFETYDEALRQPAGV